MDSNTIRTFIALNLGPEIQDAILNIQAGLKKIDCNVKWVEPQNIHLTLKFLGDVEPKKIDVLKQTLTNLCASVEPIETGLTQLDAFPSMDRPQVLWVGLKDNDRQLMALAKTLEKTLERLGFKRNEKPFSPHITIGRTRPLKNISLLSQAISEFSLSTNLLQTFNNVALYKSTLTPQNPIYEVLCEFSLDKH